MNWVFVQEVCEAVDGLELEGLSIPAGLYQKLADVFSTPGTNTVENQFRAGRKVENRDQDSRAVSSSRKWWAPIGQGVLVHRFHFTEAPWRLEVMTPEDPKAMRNGPANVPAGHPGQPFRRTVIQPVDMALASTKSRSSRNLSLRL